jgi:hypothetical protein
MTARLPVCRNAADLERLLTYVADRDVTAYSNALLPLLLAHQCRMLDKGQDLHVDREGAGGVRCVRIQGEADCWWSTGSALEAAPVH